MSQSLKVLFSTFPFSHPLSLLHVSTFGSEFETIKTYAVLLNLLCPKRITKAKSLRIWRGQFTCIQLTCPKEICSINQMVIQSKTAILPQDNGFRCGSCDYFSYPDARWRSHECLTFLKVDLLQSCLNRDHRTIWDYYLQSLCRQFINSINLFIRNLFCSVSL